MTQGEARILPCPFCGGEAEHFICEERDNYGGQVIGCKTCLASTRVFFGECEGLFPAWNTRTPAIADGVGVEWQTIDTAPKDGTALIGMDDNGEVDSIHWGVIDEELGYTWISKEQRQEVYPRFWIHKPVVTAASHDQKTIESVPCGCYQFVSGPRAHEIVKCSTHSTPPQAATDEGV